MKIIEKIFISILVAHLCIFVGIIGFMLVIKEINLEVSFFGINVPTKSFFLLIVLILFFNKKYHDFIWKKYKIKKINIFFLFMCIIPSFLILGLTGSLGFALIKGTVEEGLIFDLKVIQIMYLVPYEIKRELYYSFLFSFMETMNNEQFNQYLASYEHVQNPNKYEILSCSVKDIPFLVLKNINLAKDQFLLSSDLSYLKKEILEANQILNNLSIKIQEANAGITGRNQVLLFGILTFIGYYYIFS